MRVLVIDNYDSFTNNIVQAVRSLGFSVDVRLNDAVDYVDVAGSTYGAIILSPGPGNARCPTDIGICADILRDDERPILGICLGYQAMAVAAGATLCKAPTPVHGGIEPIHHRGDALFAGLPTPFDGVRYHSWVIGAALPPLLKPIAWTAEGMVMGVRHQDQPRWGVQFHPESICTGHGRQILHNFLVLAGLVPDIEGATSDVIAADVIAADVIAAGCGAPAGTPQPSIRAERLSRWIQPAEAHRYAYADKGPGFWLDSARRGAGARRVSYMGTLADGIASHLVAFRNGDAFVTRTARDGTVATCAGDMIAHLEAALPVQTIIGGDDLPFAFRGGYVGYLGYELNGVADAGFGDPPDAAFLYVDRFLAFDHEERAVWAVQLDPDGAGGSAAQADFDIWKQGREAVVSAAAFDPPDTRTPPPRDGNVAFSMRHSLEDYRAKVRRCQALIVEGESYELCLTQHLHCAERPDPTRLYAMLRALNPAPYAGFLNFGAFQILSSSPECFVRMDASGSAVSRPIKGTIRRGRTPQEDAALQAELAGSAKDFAETLMIVDLVRHDMGGVCTIGSVTVPELAVIESYQTVHQMVSTVAGQRRPDVHPIRFVEAAFPGGSMTGAPKRRTMALLAEIEGGRRGIYAGALGYLSVDGAVDLAVVIRTLVVDADGVSLGCGGAITILSDVDAEVDEMMLKAAAPMAAVARCLTGDAGAYDLVDRATGARIHHAQPIVNEGLR